jgi:hypothetical protein
MPIRRKKEKIADVPIPVQDESKLMFFPITEVPSKFLCYPKELEISYRRYGWLELKLLSQRRNTISLRTQAEIVLRGLRFSGVEFNPYNLTFTDYEFLGLLRKVATVSPPAFDLKYMCEKCKRVSSFTVPVSGIQFDDIKAPKGRAKVKLDSMEAVFQPLSLGQFLNVCDLQAEYPEWEEELMWAASCVSYPLEEIFMYFKERATPDDAKLLRKLDKLFFHGIMPMKNICKNYIVEVLDQTEHNRLDGMTREELKKEITAKGSGFSLNDPERDLEQYMVEKKIIKKTRCSEETELALDGGQGLIVPFRFSGVDFEDAVQFDDAWASTD